MSIFKVSLFSVVNKVLLRCPFLYLFLLTCDKANEFSYTVLLNLGFFVKYRFMLISLIVLKFVVVEIIVVLARVLKSLRKSGQLSSCISGHLALSACFCLCICLLVSVLVFVCISVCPTVRIISNYNSYV